VSKISTWSTWIPNPKGYDPYNSLDREALYTIRNYSCGCTAEGYGDIPNYCPEHVGGKAGPIRGTAEHGGVADSTKAGADPALPHPAPETVRWLS